MNCHADTSLHVLLVEQDDSILELFSTLLCGSGYIVSTARTGMEALDLASDAAPHAVFSSLVFDDIDGFELCRRLRAAPGTADSLIVALTGYSQPGIQQQVAQAGFDSYLLKPVSVHTLLGLIESYAADRQVQHRRARVGATGQRSAA
jgi:two-component system CheB/CheR fusion protein